MKMEPLKCKFCHNPIKVISRWQKQRRAKTMTDHEGVTSKAQIWRIAQEISAAQEVSAAQGLCGRCEQCEELEARWAALIPHLTRLLDYADWNLHCDWNHCDERICECDALNQEVIEDGEEPRYGEKHGNGCCDGGATAWCCGGCDPHTGCGRHKPGCWLKAALNDESGKAFLAERNELRREVEHQRIRADKAERELATLQENFAREISVHAAGHRQLERERNLKARNYENP